MQESQTLSRLAFACPKSKLVTQLIDTELNYFLNTVKHYCQKAITSKILKFKRRQDGGVEGCELTTSYENTKSQLTTEQPPTKIAGTYQK